MFVVSIFTNPLFILIPFSESLRWETLTTALSLFLRYFHATINLTLFMKYLIAYCSKQKGKKRNMVHCVKSVSLRIQSEYGKIRTIKNSVFRQPLHSGDA